MWLRSDYSLALTKFVSAEVANDENNYGEGGRVCEKLTLDECVAYVGRTKREKGTCNYPSFVA
jgi:hypothetical protein